MSKNKDNTLHPVNMLRMIEVFIKGHELTLKEELESGNFGEDFADAIYISRKLFDMLKQTQDERDEARRDVCDMMHITGFLAGDYAASRGWDCFPDRKRNVSDEVKNFRTIIERDYNAVVAQRDEARREAMLLLSERSSEKEMREEYRKRGWSYLLPKDNNNDT
jgi:hypothetical protein